MKKILTPHTVFFLAALFLVAGCDVLTEEETEERDKVLVELSPVETTSLVDDIRTTGQVEAFEEAYIGAAGASRIEQIMVDVGDQVEKDQLLVQMDRSQLFQARVQLDNLREDLRRLDTLVAVGAATQQQYDQLKTQYDVAESNVENLEENTQIRANIPGVITGRYFSDGEIFSMSPTTPEGRIAILSLKQIQPVKITIGVSQRYFPMVEKGQEVIIQSDVYPDREFSGNVHKIYPTIDRVSGTFDVEVLVENRDLALRPGMYSRVMLNIGEIEGLLVPSLAVRKQVGADERFVFVVEDGVAHRRTVTLGRTFDDKLEILSGIEAGEMLVTTGQQNLMDQSEVEIVN
ncbi:MAG: efflux RND transporter periplasmic adaptor subunit [Bacteroidales bacterium]